MKDVVTSLTSKVSKEAPDTCVLTMPGSLSKFLPEAPRYKGYKFVRCLLCKDKKLIAASKMKNHVHDHEEPLLQCDENKVFVTKNSPIEMKANVSNYVERDNIEVNGAAGKNDTDLIKISGASEVNIVDDSIVDCMNNRVPNQIVDLLNPEQEKPCPNVKNFKMRKNKMRVSHEDNLEGDECNDEKNNNPEEETEAVVSRVRKLKYCWNCVNISRYTCCGCRKAKYCGEKCQWDDWESHKEYCLVRMNQIAFKEFEFLSASLFEGDKCKKKNNNPEDKTESVASRVRKLKFCWNCVNISRYTCSGCRKARYCEVKCQWDDWESHKVYCLVRMNQIAFKQFEFLSASLFEGDECKEKNNNPEEKSEAAVSIVRKLNFCWNCVNISIYTCSGCRKAKYCEEKCQWDDWESHKEFCLVRMNQIAFKQFEFLSTSLFE